MLDQPKPTAPEPDRAVTPPRTEIAQIPAPNDTKAGPQTIYEALDRAAHANLAKATSGLSPSALGEAWMDWAVHLAASPLRLFINDSEVTLIEDMMAEKGCLTSDQMVGAFALLRARALIWAPAIRNHLLGQRGDAFDLMAWNADATRMHSEYLRKLFLNNDLAEGRYKVEDGVIAFAGIRAPIFAIGAEDDQVAPWPSVYKLHLFADADITFVLTSGGHNAGIVSEPGHHDRHFRVADTPAEAAYRAPAEWLADTEVEDGSWWRTFATRLSARSGKAVDPQPMGARSGAYKALCDAPGTYVMQT